jgi:hypothetical protein
MTTDRWESELQVDWRLRSKVADIFIAAAAGLSAGSGSSGFRHRTGAVQGSGNRQRRTARSVECSDSHSVRVKAIVATIQHRQSNI